MALVVTEATSLDRRADAWKPASGTWGLNEAKAMARAWQESDAETLAGFARQHGLGPERLRWWLRKLGVPALKSAKAAGVGRPAVFSQVRVVSRQSPVARPAHGSATVGIEPTTQQPMAVGEFEVVLRGGRRLRLVGPVDTAVLRQVVRALEEGC